MKQFENLIMSFPMNKKDGLTTMQDELNTLGREGWEVVSIVGSDFADVGMRAFMKREIISERDQGREA